MSISLTPQTTAAFESYLKSTESKMTGSPRYGQLRAGEVRVDPSKDDGAIGVKYGLIHDWVAATWIPGASVEQTIAVLQNYGEYKSMYQPEVVDSRLLAHNGEQCVST
ncbi:MAG: hypothetical protein WDO18_11450 [Acidobacteriota bacterium]